MSSISVFLVFFFISGALALLYRKRFEEMLPLGIFCIVFPIYVSGLLTTFEPGFYFVFFCAFVSALFIGRKYVYCRKDVYELLCTPGFFTFCILMVFIWWGHQGRMSISWDDFSNWNLNVKNMYVFHDFANIAGSTAEKIDYPPAASIFSYFWVRLAGYFSDDNLIRSMNVLLLSFVLPIFKAVSWGQPLRFVLFFVLCILLPTIGHPNAYVITDVDALIGVVAAYSLFTFFSNKIDMANGISVAASLALLPLIKAVGSLFAVFVLLSCACTLVLRLERKSLFLLLALISSAIGAFLFGASFLVPLLILPLSAFLIALTNENETLLTKCGKFGGMFSKKLSAPLQKNKKEGSKKCIEKERVGSNDTVKKIDFFERTSFRDCIWLFFFIVAFLTGKYSWDIYLRATGVGATWGTSNLSAANISELIRGFFDGSIPHYRLVTIWNYFFSLALLPVNGFLLTPSVGGWFFLLLASGCFLLIVRAPDRSRMQLPCECAVLFTWGAMLVYAAFLLFSYLFLFSEYEAVRCASFIRYWGSFIAFAFIFHFSMMLFSMEFLKKSGRMLVGIITFSIATLLIDPSFVASLTYDARASVEKTIIARRRYEPVKRIIDNIDGRREKIWLIDQHSNGYGFQVMRYNLAPISVSKGGWSLGTPAGERDVWTRNITAAEWAEELKSFQWVYLVGVEASFVQNFHSLFEDPATIANDAFYKVRADGDSVVLTYVDI